MITEECFVILKYKFSSIKRYPILFLCKGSSCNILILSMTFFLQLRRTVQFRLNITRWERRSYILIYSPKILVTQTSWSDLTSYDSREVEFTMYCVLTAKKTLKSYHEAHLTVEHIFWALLATEDMSRKISRKVSFAQTEINSVQWQVASFIPSSAFNSVHVSRSLSFSASWTIRICFSRSCNNQHVNMRRTLFKKG